MLAVCRLAEKVRKLCIYYSMEKISSVHLFDGIYAVLISISVECHTRISNAIGKRIRKRKHSLHIENVFLFTRVIVAESSRIEKPLAPKCIICIDKGIAKEGGFGYEAKTSVAKWFYHQSLSYISTHKFQQLSFCLFFT